MEKDDDDFRIILATDKHKRLIYGYNMRIW